MVNSAIKIVTLAEIKCITILPLRVQTNDLKWHFQLFFACICKTRLKAIKDFMIFFN